MSRQSPGQRWCSVVLLALFLSLFLYYGMPSLAFRLGRAFEAGRNDAEFPSVPPPVVGPNAENHAVHLARASRQARLAVVRIEALKSLEAENAPTGGGPSGGSHAIARRSTIAHGCGLLIDREGWVVTSRHVVNGASAIRIHLPAHRNFFVARIAGSDPGTDLAVLRFDPPAGDISATPLDDAAPVEIGQYVMAVGNAYRPGEFLWLGVINSCGGKSSPACCNVHDCIHTTAVNGWNFGGPLLNLEGGIVGINTALREADGLPVGVAVPAATARQVVAQLRRQGQVSRGWLGVFIHKESPVAGAQIPAVEFPEGSLAVAVDYVVPGSPAEQGGLQAGDVIFRFDDESFESAAALRRRIASTTPGAKVGVALVRAGVDVAARVVVGQSPATPPQLPGEREWGIRLLGHLSASESKQVGVDHLAGVVVWQVEPHRKAKELLAHDVILSVNDVATPDLATFCRVASRHLGTAPGQKVRLEISSSGVKKPIVIGDE